MATLEPAQPPEAGAVRFTEDGRVEYYDGTVWAAYAELPDGGDSPLLRGGDGSSSEAGDQGGTR